MITAKRCAYPMVNSEACGRTAYEAELHTEALFQVERAAGETASVSR
jgi:hypothetical protein